MQLSVRTAPATRLSEYLATVVMRRAVLASLLGVSVAEDSVATRRTFDERNASLCVVSFFPAEPTVGRHRLSALPVAGRSAGTLANARYSTPRAKTTPVAT